MSMETDWMTKGNCRQEPSSTFFPHDSIGVEVAQRICAGCPVKGPCLEYALLNHIFHGIWGGASERERRRIARRRRKERAGSPAPAERSDREPVAEGA